jgi:uncharacterized protein YjbJ (UPF0337 family)
MTLRGAPCFDRVDANISEVRFVGFPRIPSLQEKTMNKDRIAGAAKTQMGKAEQVAGKATKSTNMQAKGVAKEAEGRVQNAAGKARDALKKAAKH